MPVMIKQHSGQIYNVEGHGIMMLLLWDYLYMVLLNVKLLILQKL